MKLLISGSCGFIGSNFVIQNADKHDITVLDSLTYAADIHYLDSVKDRIKLIIADIRNYEEQMPSYDAIVNFAAESSVDVSIKNPRLFAGTNVLGTINMLELARKCDAKFLQISTDEVYGDTTGLPPSEECDMLLPSSPYSASKASADMFVLAYARTYGLRTNVTRTCNNYGRHQHEEKLIPKFIKAAIRDHTLTVYGKGEAIREWIHVEDNCEAIMTVLERGEDGEIYNIGTGERKTVMEVAEAILKATGSKSEIQFVDERPGEDMRYALDSLKMRMLGWKPKISFEEGLKRTVEWYVGR